MSEKAQKRKRAIFVALAVSIAAALTVGLVACGKTDGNGVGGNVNFFGSGG